MTQADTRQAWPVLYSRLAILLHDYTTRRRLGILARRAIYNGTIIKASTERKDSFGENNIQSQTNSHRQGMKPDTNNLGIEKMKFRKARFIPNSMPTVLFRKASGASSPPSVIGSGLALSC